MYSRNTLNNYRSELKRLRKLFGLMPVDHPQRKAVTDRIDRLANILGKELGKEEMEAFLAKKPGRQPGMGLTQTPMVDTKKLLKELTPKDETYDATKDPDNPSYWSPEAVEARKVAFREKLANSQKSLEEMQSLGGDDGKQRDGETTGQSGPVGGIDKV